MSATQKYTRIIQLGKGGMAVVYLAAMRAAHGATKLVVVKELLPDLALDPEFRVMFVDEARLATRLNHPNVVNTFEVLDDGEGKCSIVMEYLEGQPLSRLRHALRDHQLFLPIQLAVIADVLNGLQYAHDLKDYDGTSLNIVHRDISPHNVFVNYTGEVKIVDFGIAKANDSIAETRVGVVKGKFGYMAPEQAIGIRIDRRADLFSVGVMMFEALVGARMWRGLNEAAITHKLTMGDIPTPSAVRADVPPELDAVCKKALAKDPDERYGTAAEFVADLEVAANGLPSRRVIGETVTQLFAAEREKIARVLEEQLGSMKASSSGGFVPPVEAPKIVHFPKGTLSEAQQPTTIPAPDIQIITGTGATSGNAARSVKPQAMGRNLPLLIGGAAALLILAGGIFAAVRIANGNNRVAASPPASVDSTTITTVIARPATASNKSTLTLKLNPPDAKLSVDGSELPSGTTKLEGSKDSLPRTLHVEAPGFQPKDVQLTFAIDTTVEISLERAIVVPTGKPVATGRPLATGKPIGKPVTTAKPTSTEPDIGY